MIVDYNSFATSFAQSRKNMKWSEIEYFFWNISSEDSILDIGCGSGRLLWVFMDFFWRLPHVYLGIDLSENILAEARKEYPHEKFLQWDMRDISKILSGEIYDNVFCIASFHHLETLQERIDFLKSVVNFLPEGWKIYMTNWALSSKLNYEKYKDSMISESDDEFWSKDYSIKIGKSQRYYHDFSLKELDFLAEASELKIVENRIFETEKNIITIFQK